MPVLEIMKDNAGGGVEKIKITLDIEGDCPVLAKEREVKKLAEVCSNLDVVAKCKGVGGTTNNILVL